MKYCIQHDTARKGSPQHFHTHPGRTLYILEKCLINIYTPCILTRRVYYKGPSSKAFRHYNRFRATVVKTADTRQLRWNPPNEAGKHLAKASTRYTSIHLLEYAPSRPHRLVSHLFVHSSSDALPRQCDAYAMIHNRLNTTRAQEQRTQQVRHERRPPWLIPFATGALFGVTINRPSAPIALRVGRRTTEG